MPVGSYTIETVGDGDEILGFALEPLTGSAPPPKQRQLYEDVTELRDKIKRMFPHKTKEFIRFIEDAHKAAEKGLTGEDAKTDYGSQLVSQLKDNIVAQQRTHVAETKQTKFFFIFLSFLVILLTAGFVFIFFAENISALFNLKQIETPVNGDAQDKWNIIHAIPKWILCFIICVTGIFITEYLKYDNLDYNSIEQMSSITTVRMFFTFLLAIIVSAFFMALLSTGAIGVSIGGLDLHKFSESYSSTMILGILVGLSQSFIHEKLFGFVLNVTQQANSPSKISELTKNGVS